jgi:SET domain-containing protein
MKRASETHPSHDIYVDAEHMGGITRFMNHSCAANCVFQEMRNGRVHTAVVVTTRGVLPGEEVTVHYGQDLWFICRCGEASCQHRDIQHLENPF